MKFGLFGSALAKRGGPDLDSGQGFREWVDYNVEAEALGYNSIFVVEHHFTGFGQVSASLNLLTWVAARTKTLRLGTAVMVLPWHNPVLLAEQAATIDLLSGGRLDFGVGKGYRHAEFASFCIPQEEADARFEEGLEVIIKSWTSNERFSHHGKFWNFENIIVEPPTAQKPHPPIWMAAGSPDSIRKVARRGAKLLLDQHRLDGSSTIERFNIYKAEVEKPAAGTSIRWMSASAARSSSPRTPRTRPRPSRRGSPTSSGWSRLDADAGRQQAPRACCRSTRRSMPRPRARCSARRTRSRPSLRRCAPPASSTCCSTVRPGSRENLRAFARDMMPAFAGAGAAAAAVGRRQPQLANS